MKYLIIILISLLLILLFILPIILRIRKQMAKYIIQSELDLPPADIKDLASIEQEEIIKLTNVLKNHNFVNEEDYLLKSNINEKGLFLRLLRNVEDGTIARIVCSLKLNSSDLNKSLSLINVNSENEILFSKCSNQGDFLPESKIKEIFITKDFNELENLIEKHKEIIKNEKINSNYMKLSTSECEKFIHELDKKEKIKEGYWHQNGENYYYTSKALNIITIKTLKEIFQNKNFLLTYLIIWLLCFYTAFSLFG